MINGSPTKPDTLHAAYRYDAWGLPQGAGSYATGIWTQGTSLVNSTLAGQIASRQVLRYAAYAWDAESSLYYCSARYYDPATRQWTTGDPAKADGEESAYQYCGGEPITTIDETGRYTRLLSLPRSRTSLKYSGLLMDVLRTNAMVTYWHRIQWWKPWRWLSNIDWFYHKVRKRGPWDFKLAAKTDWRDDDVLAFRGARISAEEFGNIHYGYVGAAMNFPWDVVSAGSIVAMGRWLPLLDWPNEEVDQLYIAWGYGLYLRYGRKGYGSGGPSQYIRTPKYESIRW